MGQVPLKLNPSSGAPGDGVMRENVVFAVVFAPPIVLLGSGLAAATGASIIASSEDARNAFGAAGSWLANQLRGQVDASRAEANQQGGSPADRQRAQNAVKKAVRRAKEATRRVGVAMKRASAAVDRSARLQRRRTLAQRQLTHDEAALRRYLATRERTRDPVRRQELDKWITAKRARIDKARGLIRVLDKQITAARNEVDAAWNRLERLRRALRF